MDEMVSLFAMARKMVWYD